MKQLQMLSNKSWIDEILPELIRSIWPEAEDVTVQAIIKAALPHADQDHSLIDTGYLLALVRITLATRQRWKESGETSNVTQVRRHLDDRYEGA